MKSVHDQARPLTSVDLNLLVVLDALLRDGSATRAARRLARTQSAISHALQRLRDAFGDPLFVRVGSTLKPTPHAEALRAPLADVLQRAGALFAPATFDAATLERAFYIGSTDLLESVVFPGLLDELSREAPRVTLRTLVGGADMERALQQRELDVAFVTRLRSEIGLRFDPLFPSALSLVLRRGHPMLRRRGPIDLDAYCNELRHVFVAPRGLPGGPVDDALDALGRTRQVVMRTPSFTGALRVVAATDLVTALPAQFAKAAGRAVLVRPLPLEVPPFLFRLAWSAALDDDPAQRWLRTKLRTAILRGFGVEGRPSGTPLA